MNRSLFALMDNDENRFAYVASINEIREISVVFMSFKTVNVSHPTSNIESNRTRRIAILR